MSDYGLLNKAFKFNRWHERAITSFCASPEGITLKNLLDATGVKNSLEDFIVRDEIGEWYANGASSSAVSALKWHATTTLGTATGRQTAGTNNYTSQDKLGYVSAASSGSFCGVHTTGASVRIGSGIVGGFTKIIKFGCSDAATVAGARQFIGISSDTGSPTNVEPSTLTNCIGVGHGASDTNLFIYYGGSVAQTPIDLGASYPANTLSLDPYELALFSFTELNNKVGYQVKHLLTGAVARGILTAATPGVQLPASTTMLTIEKNWRCNNATALAVGIDIFGMMKGIRNNGFI